MCAAIRMPALLPLNGGGDSASEHLIKFDGNKLAIEGIKVSVAKPHVQVIVMTHAHIGGIAQIAVPDHVLVLVHGYSLA